MEIFKQLSKKAYKHYYDGTIEELDSMGKDNPDLHSEIMQVILWLYEKHGIWISVDRYIDREQSTDYRYGSCIYSNEHYYGRGNENPTEAYEAAITYVLNSLI